jgi:EAL domain-containing protein (putative c-di-GMP-specific phosphodiesterase class I)/DNA-binding NarL/FixJ family response regulator
VDDVEPIRVLVADDDPDILEVLVDLVGSDSSMELVGTAADADEAIDLARHHQPDIAVLDARMPGGGGPRAARAIRARSPFTEVVALSAAEDGDTVMQMLDSGASAYVCKADPPIEIVRAIRRCGEGKASLSERIRSDIAESLAEQVSSLSGARRGAAVQSRIREAMAGNALQMVFQPIVDLATGNVLAVEALARFMTRPRRSPDLWFEQAWEHGLGVELESAAASRALSCIDHLPPEILLAVNASPEVLCSRPFVKLLDDIPVTRLIVEITEHMRFDDWHRLNTTVKSLRADGMLLSIDDFGAGFSALSRIVELRPDFIKLDRALTWGIDRDSVRQDLVQTLLTFAGRIGSDVIAEGIETDRQIAPLLELGVEFGQGFLLGRPGPLPPRDLTGGFHWGGRHAFSRARDSEGA